MLLLVDRPNDEPFCSSRHDTCALSANWPLLSCRHACTQEEKALKALKEKAKGGAVGGAGLKKSGKK